MRKLIATVAAGGAAALIIALAGNPGAVETIANASSVHSSAAMMKKSKKCKKGYKKNKKGKCVKKPKPKPKPTTTTGANTTTTGTNTTTTSTGTTGTTTTGASTKPTSAEVEAGKTLFNKECESCHGAMGEGKTGLAPAYGAELPRSESIKGVVEQLEHALNEKGCKCMPPSFPALSTMEKEEIGAYVAVELTKKEKIGGGG